MATGLCIGLVSCSLSHMTHLSIRSYHISSIYLHASRSQAVSSNIVHTCPRLGYPAYYTSISWYNMERGFVAESRTLNIQLVRPNRLHKSNHSKASSAMKARFDLPIPPQNAYVFCSHHPLRCSVTHHRSLCQIHLMRYDRPKAQSGSA